MAHDVLKWLAMNTATLRQASRSLRPLATFLALAGALCATACNPVVIGGHNQGGGGGAGGGTGATGGGTTTAINAIALPYVLLDHPQSPPDGSSGAGGSFGVDPGTLYVQLGNFAQNCSNNQPPYCSTGALSWQVSVGIPPALQVPGVIQLSDPSLISTFSENGPNSGTPGDCFGGGGSFVEGTMEILSIDADNVVFSLSGTSPGFGDFDADGAYVAPVCPTGV